MLTLQTIYNASSEPTSVILVQVLSALVLIELVDNFFSRDQAYDPVPDQLIIFRI